jgi:hypothetical protein
MLPILAVLALRGRDARCSASALTYRDHGLIATFSSGWFMQMSPEFWFAVP